MFHITLWKYPPPLYSWEMKIWIIHMCQERLRHLAGWFHLLFWTNTVTIWNYPKYHCYPLYLISLTYCLNIKIVFLTYGSRLGSQNISDLSISCSFTTPMHICIYANSLHIHRLSYFDINRYNIINIIRWKRACRHEQLNCILNALLGILMVYKFKCVWGFF